MRKTLCAALLSVLCSVTPGVAQNPQIAFPTYSAENPLKIGFVSKLSVERRAMLVRMLDEADKDGFFPPEVEARGKDPFGMILYILPSWEGAKELPPHILPSFAADQLQNINPGFFRYAIPARKKNQEVFVLMFYIATQSNDATLRCLAEDLVVVLREGFTSGASAPCARGE